MRLVSLAVHGFKNLNDVVVSFEDCSLYTVLLGQNGSGKSNLIEALVVIFSKLDSGENVPFTFDLTYELASDGDDQDIRMVRIQQAAGRSPVVFLNAKEVSRSELTKVGELRSKDLLPRFVFAYYSGPSARLQSYFLGSQERFYQQLKKPTAISRELPARRMFLAQTRHSQFVLLAFYSHPDQVAQDFLREHLSILDIDFIKFVIRKPGWAKANTQDRFWGTTGVPRQMLDLLDKASIATTRTRSRQQIDFRRSTSVECLNFLLDRAAFENMAKEYETPQDLFKALESTDISDLLLDLEVTVRVENVNGSISHHELSEGEQQLLLVLGLLRFTKQANALFLLDEPDTHLNPAWSVQFLRFIQNIVGAQPKSQILMATHDPLVFAGLTRDQVRIMQWDDQGKVIVSQPDEDPRGMGIEAILTSDLFGLRAAIDLPTLDKLDERQDLLVLKERSIDQQSRLDSLNQEIEALGYGNDYADPVYAQFEQAFVRWRQNHRLAKPVLNDAERAAQKQAAYEMLKRIKKQGDKNEENLSF